jgi:exonuclease SbcD
MRFLHLADLHLGKIVNGFNMLNDQRFALHALVETAAERQVDAVVLAGDLYDKSQPSADAVALFDEFLTELAHRHLPCLAIAGNHDSAERVAYAGRLLRESGIVVTPPYDGAVTTWSTEDEHGPVTFWLLPFIRPIDVRRAFPDRSDEIGRDYTQAMRVALDACELDPTQRNVLVAHQFVTYAGAEPQRSDSELSVGGLDNIDGHLFDAFDYVALGHIHSPQRVGRDTMRYAGSLLKYSYSEARQHKSAVLVDLGAKGQVEIELIPIPARHDLREIRGSVEQLTSMEALAAAAEARAAPDDYIHAVLTDADPAPSDRERLRAAYPNLMGYEYESSTRGGDTGTAAAEYEEAEQPPSPLELFTRFYEDMNGKPLDDDQRQIAEDAMTAAVAHREN